MHLHSTDILVSMLTQAKSEKAEAQRKIWDCDSSLHQLQDTLADKEARFMSFGTTTSRPYEISMNLWLEYVIISVCSLSIGCYKAQGKHTP